MESSSRPPFWMRCAARTCDYLLLYFLIACGFEFAPYYIPESYFWGLAALVPLLWAPFEALLYSWLGTTPGKALFGIRVVGRSGKKPSFLSAVKQAFALRKNRSGRLNLLDVPYWRRYVGLAAVVVGAVCFGLHEQGTRLLGGPEKKVLPIEHWVQFEPKSEPFSLSLPVDPSFSAQEYEVSGAPAPLVHKDWSAHIGTSTIYSISYLDLPKKWTIAGARTLLKGSLEMVVERTPGGILVEKNFTTHQGHPAISFRMMQDACEIQGVLILVKGRVYKASVTVPADLAAESNYDPFLASLDIR